MCVMHTQMYESARVRIDVVDPGSLSLPPFLYGITLYNLGTVPRPLACLSLIVNIRTVIQVCWGRSAQQFGHVLQKKG